MVIEKCTNKKDVARLYLDFLNEMYQDRSVATFTKCLNIVNNWFKAKLDVYGIIEDGKLYGFSLSYIDTNGGTIKPEYRAEITYVVPELRKTKWSYKLLKLPIELGLKANLPVVSKSTTNNGVNKLHRKLGGQLIFEERILIV